VVYMLLANAVCGIAIFEWAYAKTKAVR